MFRAATRNVLRSRSSLAPARTIPERRFLTTEAPHLRGRSWKSSAARWGIAIAGIYYYNTSPVFAEEPSSNLLNPNLDALEDTNSSSPTLDALTSRPRGAQKQPSTLESTLSATSTENASTTTGSSQSHPTPREPSSSPADLEAEADQQGAFNPETGEINWDCACLGGMAHGPCGPEFREAFSCFVYSTEEPKGMDCIERFKGMQDCFQKYPEIYKGELEDDEENAQALDEGLEGERQELIKEIGERQQEEQPQRRLLEEEAAPLKEKKQKQNKKSKKLEPTANANPAHEAKVQASLEQHPSKSDEQEDIFEGQSSQITSPPPVGIAMMPGDDELVPKAAFDARMGGGKSTEK